MELKDKVIFDVQDANSNLLNELPEKYKTDYKYIFFVNNNDFSLFNYGVDRSTEYKTPFIPNLCKAMGLNKKDYIIFGKSTGHNWSDGGCCETYAVACIYDVMSLVDIELAIQVMWAAFELEYNKLGLTVTTRYDRYCIENQENAQYYLFRPGVAYRVISESRNKVNVKKILKEKEAGKQDS